MRILRVAQHIYPDTKGGARYHVHALSRDQASKGHDVTVLTTRSEDSLPRIEETHGYTVIRLSPGLALLGNDISPAVAKYLRGVKDNDFDVIHAHSHLYFATNLAALKRRRGEVPLAITNHGLYSQSVPMWPFKLYLKSLGRWTFNQADLVFCYTETDQKRLRNLGVRSRIEVVPNGIDTKRFTPEGPESELIEDNGPVVLFVGRLVQGKRPGVAIAAFAEVLETYPEASMYVCGDGPVREKLDRLVSTLGISDAVTFLGHVSYDEMPKVYRSGDVLVLPSRAEGVPRTVLEAIACGVRPVTSKFPQLQSVMRSNVHQVNGNSPGEVADAIISVLPKKEETVKPESINEIDWETTVTRTTEHLKSLVQ